MIYELGLKLIGVFIVAYFISATSYKIIIIGAKIVKRDKKIGWK
jgi:hypothetical protein